MPGQYCSQCGNILQPGDVFCRACGAAQAALPIQTLPNLRGNKSPRAAWGSELTPAQLKNDLQGWGIGMILVGVLSFIFPQYLDKAWGGVIIVLGLLNLVVIKKFMYLVNGLALITVGVMNFITILAAAGVSYFWGGFGIMQVIWGFQEIAKFFKSYVGTPQNAASFPVRPGTAAVRLTLLPVERKDVEYPSITGRQALNQAVDGLARVWIAEDKPSRAELTISGYDSDPRELYEIPEVCNWARRVVNEVPVLPLFLTNASLDRFAAWLCGPVDKAGLASREFMNCFADTRKKVLTAAIADSSAYFASMGAAPALISKFYMQSIANNEDAPAGNGFRNGTAPARQKTQPRPLVKSRGRYRYPFTPGVIVAGVILAMAIVAGSIALTLSLRKPIPLPEFNLPTLSRPALSAPQNQPGSICWTRELTKFDGSRADVWEKLLDERTRNLLPFNTFKDQVLLYNPQLKADGYVFYGQKSYLIPQMCP